MEPKNDSIMACQTPRPPFPTRPAGSLRVANDRKANWCIGWIQSVDATPGCQSGCSSSAKTSAGGLPVENFAWPVVERKGNRQYAIGPRAHFATSTNSSHRHRRTSTAAPRAKVDQSPRSACDCFTRMSPLVGPRDTCPATEPRAVASARPFRLAEGHKRMRNRGWHGSGST